jgi:hypothetical protein
VLLGVGCVRDPHSHLPPCVTHGADGRTNGGATCARAGWCGSSAEHCSCDACADYSLAPGARWPPDPASSAQPPVLRDDGPVDRSRFTARLVGCWAGEAQRRSRELVELDLKYDPKSHRGERGPSCSPGMTLSAGS